MRTYEFWKSQINLYEREFKKWETRAEKIVERYRDERDEKVQSKKFNIFWSNVQTAMPACFSRLPQPEVTRRFNDGDPVGRVAALLIERGLDYELQQYKDYRECVEGAVEDRFIVGRGTAWVRYEPEFAAAEKSEEDGAQLTDTVDEDEEQDEVIEWECSPTDYVYWQDFGHNLCRNWNEVYAVWRRVYLSKDKLKARFPEIWEKIPLDHLPEGMSKEQIKNYGDSLNTACIYEIWDKESGKVYWLSKSYPDIIEEQDDPLELDDFFPCPKPLYATTTTNSLTPIPDYAQYQDQSIELDMLTNKISKLEEALAVKGVYDASEHSLKRLLQETMDNELIPVKNWSIFSEKGGINGAIMFMPIKEVADALLTAYEARDKCKEVIYEITGQADIMRGASDPNETAKAQKLKSQFGSIRLRQTQNRVAMFASELMRIKAQIICKHYSPQTIIQISGAEMLEDADKQLVMPAIELIKNSPLSKFRIEIASDSLVEIDEQQDKDDRVEFLKAASEFMGNAAQMAQNSPAMLPLLGEMLMFGVRGFKVGRTLEGVFDKTIKDLEAQAQQAAQNPQPSDAQIKAQSDMQKAQMQMQGKQQEIQLKAQLEQQKQTLQAQSDQVSEQARAQADIAAENAKMEAQLQIERARLAFDERVKLLEMQSNERVGALESQIKAMQAVMDRITKLEVAELQSQTTLTAAQISAANQGANGSMDSRP